MERMEQTYETKKDELLATAKGKYVIVHGGEIDGPFRTEGAAHRAKLERYLMEDVLIKRVGEEEKQVDFMSIFLECE